MAYFGVSVGISNQLKLNNMNAFNQIKELLKHCTQEELDRIRTLCLVHKSKAPKSITPVIQMNSNT